METSHEQWKPQNSFEDKHGEPMIQDFLHEAIRLSLEKSQAGEGGPFGAVIVRNGEIIGRGWNRVTSTCDPTAHAEMNAIRDACRHLHDFSLAGCEIYTSCEPCPMCLAAIYWARLEKVHYAATRQDAAAAGFDDSRIYDELAMDFANRSVPMTQGLHDEACQAFHAWLRKPNRTPY
jgi:guanine deaminase